MELKLKIFNALCATEVFTINGKDADSNDFGEQYDEAIEDAEDYCCGNMVFARKKDSEEVLKKYNITKDEYDTICDKLEDGLSFGCCGWCA